MDIEFVASSTIVPTVAPNKWLMLIRLFLFFILAALFALHGEGSCGFELRPSSVSLLTLPGEGSCGVELCLSSVSESITRPLRDEEAGILLCSFVSGDWQPPVQVAY